MIVTLAEHPECHRYYQHLDGLGPTEKLAQIPERLVAIADQLRADGYPIIDVVADLPSFGGTGYLYATTERPASCGGTVRQQWKVFVDRDPIEGPWWHDVLWTTPRLAGRGFDSPPNDVTCWGPN